SGLLAAELRLGEQAELEPRAGVDEQVDPLARGQPSARPVPLDALPAAARERRAAAALELLGAGRGVGGVGHAADAAEDRAAWSDAASATARNSRSRSASCSSWPRVSGAVPKRASFSACVAASAARRPEGV